MYIIQNGVLCLTNKQVQQRLELSIYYKHKQLTFSRQLHYANNQLLVVRVTTAFTLLWAILNTNESTPSSE